MATSGTNPLWSGPSWPQQIRKKGDTGEEPAKNKPKQDNHENISDIDREELDTKRNTKHKPKTKAKTARKTKHKAKKESESNSNVSVEPGSAASSGEWD